MACAAKASRSCAKAASSVANSNAPDVWTSRRCKTPLRRAALAHTLHAGMARDQRVQDGARLVRVERMDGAAGGLVDREPARPLREHGERRVRFGHRALLAGMHEVRDGDAGSRLERHALGAAVGRHAVERDPAPLEQLARLRTGERQPPGEQHVQPLVRLLRIDFEFMVARLGLGHGGWGHGSRAFGASRMDAAAA